MKEYYVINSTLGTIVSDPFENRTRAYKRVAGNQVKYPDCAYRVVEVLPTEPNIRSTSKKPFKFYMVYVDRSGVPKKCHLSQAEAINEAERLATDNPNTSVFVLGAFKRFRSIEEKHIVVNRYLVEDDV